MSKKRPPATRVLQELFETTNELSAYGLVSKADMARIAELCNGPPKCAVPRVDDVYLQDERETKSGPCSGTSRN